MKIEEYVPLAPFTTFNIGGPARFFIEAKTAKDVGDTIIFARQQGLSLFVLGEGSNVLVPDAGIEGVVLKIGIRDIEIEENNERILLHAGAGTSWNDVVDTVGARGIFGIENLADIPGTVGGAIVQHIGAYGAELSHVFDHADVIDSRTGVERSVDTTEASFGYRTSFFKEHRDQIITHVTLVFTTHAEPSITYTDLVHAQADGAPLTTPVEIAYTVRAIRAGKFPRNSVEGTAGSFFKNPIIGAKLFQDLGKRFPGLPGFPQENGTVKISLAWLLDHALGLKGFAKGPVRLYENQPIVIVARTGANARDINAFANEIAEKVFVATTIRIERELETFGA